MACKKCGSERITKRMSQRESGILGPTDICINDYWETCQDCGDQVLADSTWGKKTDGSLIDTGILMGTQIENRSNQLSMMGLIYNGSEYAMDDINIHWTEITCDTEDEWNKKMQEIAAEINRRRNNSQVKGA